MAKQGEYVYDWPRPMVTADALVFAVGGERLKVLLIKRGKEPFLGKWAVPGGFLELDEELGNCAVRELQEETGLTGVRLSQMHTFGTIGRDPRGRQITVVFAGTVDEELEVVGGDDAAEAAWFDVDDLPEMAFDHVEVIAMGKTRIKELKKQRIKEAKN
jgi:8-oxo-dGTP diphosphatase